jgi:uncharacterized protein YjbI with pentapeptide repeats
MPEVRFVHSDLRKAVFTRCMLHYADFAHAAVELADFSSADLMGANMHAARDSGTVWSGANLKQVRPTDPDLLEAETYSPPRRGSA